MIQSYKRPLKYLREIREFGQTSLEEQKIELFKSNHLNKSGIDNDSVAYLRMTVVDAIEQKLNCNFEP